MKSLLLYSSLTSTPDWQSPEDKLYTRRHLITGYTVKINTNEVELISWQWEGPFQFRSAFCFIYLLLSLVIYLNDSSWMRVGFWFFFSVFCIDLYKLIDDLAFLLALEFVELFQFFFFFNSRLRKNLKSLIIVHPSWFIRTLLAITRPFIR